MLSAYAATEWQLAETLDCRQGISGVKFSFKVNVSLTLHVNQLILYTSLHLDSLECF